jgi:putative hydrolase of HD superfamily
VVEPTDAELDAVLSALALKDERRTGWQLRGVDEPETVAGHTWGVAYLCLLYAERAGVDPDRAVRLAVVHDLAEAETGDEPTRADSTVEQPDSDRKEARERAAIAELLGPFERDGDTTVAGSSSTGDSDDQSATASNSHRAAWEEYEERSSPEAQFVKDMDLVDMCFQALYYEREGRYDPTEDRPAFQEYDRLDEFFATAEPRLRTDVGRALYDAIHERYQAARDG